VLSGNKPCIFVDKNKSESVCDHMIGSIAIVFLKDCFKIISQFKIFIMAPVDRIFLFQV